ncbi:MAG: hypothetical protein EOQ86_08165 [Mesorhizobium sp.]|nr:MAG: hypothetical protein EOQ85_06550 [Mesorhizobium sp.]RWH84969.1 MAG: hypothetical protein EOQ86_08165 [Mesorhizobium sp.]RWH89726.1 MAG: hypothetical protein EOQ87_14230 [Mesorhizobium sp.]RWH98525.1 MAG: hypothetical protein EOQ88_14950 [Mesorhizobium sp.]RWI04467.1 MAG: hypothetical protein EOQ89_07610 [Mesorhizobium sp.]
MQPVAPPSVLPDISPSRGEIKPSLLLSLTVSVARLAPAWHLPISPLEGEMPSGGKVGRTEGGWRERDLRPVAALSGPAVPPP